MFEKRHRITLLFNANKAYDRQVVEGVGEYLQASQSEWDIFIEEDFRTRLENIKDWLGDGVIADYDDPVIEQLLTDVDVPIVGVGGSYHSPNTTRRFTISPPITMPGRSRFLHLKEKGVHRFAFYGLPATSGKRWAVERVSMRFASWSRRRSIAAWCIRGWKPPGKLAARAKPAGGLAANAAAANRHYCRHRRPRPPRAAGLRAFVSRCPKSCA
jgi:LacI family transcriptional regulator